MRLVLVQLVLALAATQCVGQAGGQDATDLKSSQVSNQPSQQEIEPSAVATELAEPAATGTPAVRILRSFKDSDIKFNLNDLMDALRDKRHEGWVLAAYPDPKTSHPLIGAGFTLDLPERQHVQPDPQNPHPFLEPSSADLWIAAGLDSERLDAILAQYRTRFAAWHKNGFRRRIPALAPQITDDEATQLLRISAIQAVYNARAYCRNFDRLTGPQQMALSHLVYQIGVNLVRFDDFLTQINDGAPASALAADSAADALASDRDYWLSVQHTLMQTQWARLYRTRAISVIAMLDPTYEDDPSVAEHLVGASLRPAVVHRHRGHTASLRAVSTKSRSPHAAGRKRKGRTRAKRRA
jgi:GH24 family phage-related lysozyme (muramidase)